MGHYHSLVPEWVSCMRVLAPPVTILTELDPF
jgi:hypothetical protein